jgi:hypothetical protein
MDSRFRGNDIEQIFFPISIHRSNTPDSFKKGDMEMRMNKYFFSSLLSPTSLSSPCLLSYCHSRACGNLAVLKKQDSGIPLRFSRNDRLVLKQLLDKHLEFF